MHRRNGSTTSTYLIKIYRLVDSLVIVVHVLLIHLALEHIVVGILTTTILFYVVFTKSYLALKFILLICYTRIFKVLIIRI